MFHYDKYESLTLLIIKEEIYLNKTITLWIGTYLLTTIAFWWFTHST